MHIATKITTLKIQYVKFGGNCCVNMHMNAKTTKCKSDAIKPFVYFICPPELSENELQMALIFALDPF